MPIFVYAGVPGPRIRSRRRTSRLLDEVCWFFPELKIVMRHGAEPWTELMVKLLLKWPNLYYSTSAFAPKHYHDDIVDFANTRGADKVMYAGYYPPGLDLDRIFAELPDVPVPRPGVAQVPPRERHPRPQAVTARHAQQLAGSPALGAGEPPTWGDLMGPLAGIRVVELPNIGPVQFAGMLLSDLGAEVLRVDRATAVATGVSVAGGSRRRISVIDRGRRSVGVDLKHPGGAEVVLRLCERADVLLEGFRPGVAERLGVGPDACRARNAALIYARMTGWGQDGPLAADVGHDINYLSIAGVLWHLGPEGHAPVPPINLLADFGGGGSLVVMGILAALVERASSGAGQVVDAAMVDGSAQLMSIFFGIDAMGGWGPRGTNLLDGGAHFYNVYETSDGGYVSLAAYEPKFYANLLALIGPLGFADLDPAQQMDMAQWPAWKQRFAALFATKTRDAWVGFFAGHEVCFAPVLPMSEARAHPHNVARDTFTDVEGAPQPAPAPALQPHALRNSGRAGQTGRAHRHRAHRMGVCAAEIATLKARRSDRLIRGRASAPTRRTHTSVCPSGSRPWS